MSWHEEQTNFAQALAEPALSIPDFLQPETTGRRFNVYRNNVTVSLVEALMATYPVVTQLVGDEFMQAMARVFVARFPPRSPVLIDFGSELASFITGFPPAASLPYLTDIACLEWAWHRAYHSGDAAPIGLDCLASVDERSLPLLRFEMLPSVQLLASDYPVASIWHAHQQQAASKVLGEIQSEAERVLVVRPHWRVEVRTLGPTIFAFFSRLQTGESLGEAVEALSADPSFEPGAALAALFDTGCVAALHTVSVQHNDEETD